MILYRPKTLEVLIYSQKPQTWMFVLGDAFLVDAYVVYDIENPRTFNAQASFKNREEDIKIIFDKAAGAISLLML
ncbi:BFH_collapsed_G0053500.mRNA.1.CDS.1 [Saccharomyces cerevisiae]|nr:BFH_HP2_G0052240.mRNA.1.CDS.1 [Saccharomyces cerevisiae]CAI6798057.1 BFH_HP2_G0052240.mRNA.1.CDS.1 [Saccharomyces cerevisiae]CAI7369774.1 BFH_collapsed_G0053500.mRNA.1.CDS.1 [Saccharomyces cerevisiae]